MPQDPSFITIDQAGQKIYDRLGVSLTEKNIKQAASDIGLKMFKVGNRPGFNADEFAKNFETFVEESSKRLKAELEKRKKSAFTHNIKIDALLCILELCLDLNSNQSVILGWNDIIPLLERFNYDVFNGWTGDSVKAFIVARKYRVSNPTAQASMLARDELVKLYGLDPITLQQARRSPPGSSQSRSDGDDPQQKGP